MYIYFISNLSCLQQSRLIFKYKYIEVLTEVLMPRDKNTLANVNELRVSIKQWRSLKFFRFNRPLSGNLRGVIMIGSYRINTRRIYKAFEPVLQFLFSLTQHDRVRRTTGSRLVYGTTIFFMPRILRECCV